MNKNSNEKEKLKNIKLFLILFHNTYYNSRTCMNDVNFDKHFMYIYSILNADAFYNNKIDFKLLDIMHKLYLTDNTEFIDPDINKPCSNLNFLHKYELFNDQFLGKIIS
jgi:hypothetical protein